MSTDPDCAHISPRPWCRGCWEREAVRRETVARAVAIEEAALVAESYEPHCEACPTGVASAIRHLAFATPAASPGTDGGGGDE